MAHTHSHDDHAHGHHHHSHSHHGHHHHSAEKSFRWAFVLNLLFAVIELIGGLWTNSMAVLSDALHDLGDAIAIGLGWVLERKSLQGGDKKFSYGYRRYSTVSALLTAMILIIGSFLIIAESIPRLMDPVQPHARGMLWLAVLGIIINAFAFYKMSKSSSSLNLRVLRWHFIEDIMGWVLVLMAAVTMNFFNVPILDPVLAIGLAVWVLWNVMKRLREILSVFLQAVPDHLNLQDIENEIGKVSSVIGVHHSHLWTVDGESHIFTAHVRTEKMLSASEAQKLKSEIKSKLKTLFGIGEATLELESPDEACGDPTHQTT